MDWFYSSYLRRNTKYFCFIALHLYRSFLIWLYEIIVKPLEKIVETFLKNEPTETHWVHFYSLTSCYYTTDFGIENVSFNSMETYLCPLTNTFDLFVQNEYDLFLNHSVKPPKYDCEFEQIPEIIETLFVVRKDDRYIFRTFPALNTLPDDPKLCVIPEISTIQFVIIEYKHPKMFNKIELKIPDGFYLVGNQILSPAFIQRMLELQRSYYIFDQDYEVMFIDDDLECKKIHFHNFVKIGKKTYTICTTNTENQSNEFSEDEKTEKDTERLIDESEIDEENKGMNQKRENDNEDEVKIPLSQTFIFMSCILLGGIIPLAQIIINNRGVLIC